MSKLAPFNNKRLILIAQRWASLISCGVIASAICLFIDPGVRAFCSPLIHRLESLPPALLGILLIILPGTGILFGCRGRFHGFLGMRFLPVYPPLWVAIVAGMGAWAAAGVCFWRVDRLTPFVGSMLWVFREIPLVVYVVLGVLTLTVGLFSPREADDSFEQNGSPSDKELGEDLNELCAWIKTDTEVRFPKGDRFRHDEVARRIVDRLLNTGDVPTIALMGPLGSGKTTVRCLVEYHLKKTPVVHLVPISLWPFDSPDAAVRGILRALIRELGKHINVLSLVGLSDDYVTTIEKTAGNFGGIARLLRGSSDPEQILRRISGIACAAGLRVVLWVEDLERFSGGEHLSDSVRSEREAERLGPIRALLYLLDRCPCISVVIADTSLRTRFDIGKIARYVEKPPMLDRKRVWHCAEQLRDHCLGGPIIDPTSPAARREFENDTDPNEVIEWLCQVRNSPSSVSEALADLLNTPRTLKSALRISLETWETIPGEIDFDSVLVASAIRVSRPDLFTILENHIVLLRHGLRAPSSSGVAEKTPHRVAEEIEQLLGKDSFGAQLRTLIHFLFPAYPPAQEASEQNTVVQALQRPQAFFTSGHTDYWQRYLTLKASPDGTSDQSTLRAIANWRSNESSVLPDLLIDPSRAAQIEAFGAQFEPNELCRLLTEVVNQLKDATASEWEHGYMAPPVISVWRMMLHNRPPQNSVASTVEMAIRNTTASHLPLAFCVWYFFGGHNSRNYEISTLISDEHRDMLKEVFRTALMDIIRAEKNLNGLLRAMRDGSRWLIWWICSELADGREAETGTLFEGWRELADVLLELAETKPEVGVPAIVPFFTDSRPSIHADQGPTNERRSEFWGGTCDWPRATRLFNEDRLVQILRNYVIPDDLEQQVRAHCVAAIQTAQGGLSKQGRS